MVTVGMNYQVKVGKEAVFERAFEAVLQALLQAEGHTHSALYRDTAQAQSYLIMSDWSDETKFEAFIKSEAFKRVTNWGKEEILTARPQHQVFRANSL